MACRGTQIAWSTPHWGFHVLTIIIASQCLPIIVRPVRCRKATTSSAGGYRMWRAAAYRRQQIPAVHQHGGVRHFRTNHAAV